MARKMLEQFRGDEITELLIHLPYGALQECFAAFSTTAKKPNLSGMGYAGDIVAVLKQEATGGVNEDNSGSFSIAWP